MRKRTEEPGINMTPMIDVVFQLIIFFVTTVDLEAKTISAGGAVYPFTIDDYTRHRLLNGLDDIGITLQKEDDIAAYEAQRPSFKVKTIPARVAD